MCVTQLDLLHGIWRAIEGQIPRGLSVGNCILDILATRALSPTLEALNRHSLQQPSSKQSPVLLSSGSQALHILVEESEGYMPSELPITEEELRMDSLAQFFARVAVRRADPNERIPRLKFSQRWGAKVSFVVNVADSEDTWRKIKSDIRRNFSLQSEKKPGKKEFEIWVTCEGLEALSEDNDDAW